MWEINNGPTDKLDCFNNTNYIDEALKKCKHLSTFDDWITHCDHCCNRSICKQYVKQPTIKLNENMFNENRITSVYDEWPRYVSRASSSADRNSYDDLERWSFF